MVIVAANTEKGDELRRIRTNLGMSMTTFAERLGVNRNRYKNWEYGVVEGISDDLMNKARALEKGDDVANPLAPVPRVKLKIPYIGQVAASTPVEWSDPFESLEWEDVPYEMADGRGRFAAKVVGLSMFPLLLPDDLLVFQSSNVPKLGIVVIHRSNDNKVTVKTLKHEGNQFMLVSINPEISPAPADGLIIGHLVGIVRTQGSRITTEFDPNGIRP